MEISMKISLRVSRENWEKIKEKFPYWQRDYMLLGTYTASVEVSFNGLTPAEAEAAIQELMLYQHVSDKYLPA